MGHAETMDAAQYWAGFAGEVYFTDPGDELLGVVATLDYGEDAVTKARLPRVTVRRKDGSLGSFTAYQAHLRAELLKARPKVGETLWVRYDGPDKTSAPGLSPTKRFRVKVDRPMPTPSKPDPALPNEAGRLPVPP